MSEETSRRNKGRERGRAKRKISSVIDVSPVTLFYYPRETGGRRGMIDERERYAITDGFFAFSINTGIQLIIIRLSSVANNYSLPLPRSCVRR